MKNRGPDDQSFCHLKVNNSLNIYLLHSRLSIIDLKNRSNQPFKKKHITLIFNGEIYNYKEIKKNLEELGYKITQEQSMNESMFMDALDKIKNNWSSLSREEEDIIFNLAKRF
jgi:asparagine synthetase B (glutamine-hydrolysing)